MDGRELVEQASHHVRADVARRVRADGEYSHAWAHAWSSLAITGNTVVVPATGCGV